MAATGAETPAHRRVERAQVASRLKRLATAPFSFELKLRHAARTGRRRQPDRLLCTLPSHCGPMATRSLDLETREGRAERRARLLRLQAQEAASGPAPSPPPARHHRRSRVEAGSPALRIRKSRRHQDQDVLPSANEPRVDVVTKLREMGVPCPDAQPLPAGRFCLEFPLAREVQVERASAAPLPSPPSTYHSFRPIP